MSTRVTGIVKWFNDSKGFGFITQDEKDDVFVHYSEIQAEGHRTLHEGQTVEFDMNQGPKGFHASKVSFTEEAGATPESSESEATKTSESETVQDQPDIMQEPTMVTES